jgi:hypothetical protein
MSGRCDAGRYLTLINFLIVKTAKAMMLMATIAAATELWTIDQTVENCRPVDARKIAPAAAGASQKNSRPGRYSFRWLTAHQSHTKYIPPFGFAFSTMVRIQKYPARTMAAMRSGVPALIGVLSTGGVVSEASRG